MNGHFPRRVRLMPACIIAAATALVAIAPGAADAALGTQCSGVSITAQGASVEKLAMQSVWDPDFNTSADKYACSGTQGSKGTPVVTFDSTGSGAGLESWGEFKHATAFGAANAFIGTSEAPSATQIAEIEANQTTVTPESLETVPVVQLAIAVIANLPNGCVATSTSNKGRLVLDNATLEGIFRGTINKWSEITDNGDALSQSKVKGSPTCNKEASITRVVRKDQAGTTHILKRYLGLTNPGSFEVEGGGTQTWDAISEGALNTTWPKGSVSVVKPVGKGDGEEAAEVAATPGSIGYGNLAEIRSAGSFSNKTVGGPKLQKFWVPIQNSSSETYADPASNKDSEKEANANCVGTTYTNGSKPFPPPAVTAPWNEVTTSTTETKYPLCGFTYVLALTPYSAYPGTELAEATTVENFLRYVLDPSTGGGQKLIATHDYLALPKGTVLTEAQNGATKVAF